METVLKHGTMFTPKYIKSEDRLWNSMVQASNITHLSLLTSIEYNQKETNLCAAK